MLNAVLDDSRKTPALTNLNLPGSAQVTERNGGDGRTLNDVIFPGLRSRTAKIDGLICAEGSAAGHNMNSRESGGFVRRQG